MSSLYYRLLRLAAQLKTKTRETDPCPWCNGTGYIRQFAHVDEGVCYKCRGTGIEQSSSTKPRTVRTPTTVKAPPTNEEIVKEALTELRRLYKTYKMHIDYHRQDPKDVYSQIDTALWAPYVENHLSLSFDDAVKKGRAEFFRQVKQWVQDLTKAGAKDKARTIVNSFTELVEQEKQLK